jgi:hypothetical protein
MTAYLFHRIKQAARSIEPPYWILGILAATSLIARLFLLT